MGYRMSKAALNMMTLVMSREFQMHQEDITAVAINPGYVATRMSNGRSKNDIEECMTGVVKIIETVGMESSGKFYNWDGTVLPW